MSLKENSGETSDRISYAFDRLNHTTARTAEIEAHTTGIAKLGPRLHTHTGRFKELW